MILGHVNSTPVAVFLLTKIGMRWLVVISHNVADFVANNIYSALLMRWFYVTACEDLGWCDSVLNHFKFVSWLRYCLR